MSAKLKKSEKEFEASPSNEFMRQERERKIR